jgi:hypothetical protein
LFPQVLKLSVVLLDVVRVINDYDVFLVAFSGLDCPVEGTCDQELVVYHYEFVVHVELCIAIDSARDALASKPLDVTALVVHAFIIRDDSDLDSSLMRIVYSIC